MAGNVEVRDRVLWTKHIRGAPAIAARLEGLAAGETIRLEVDGIPGLWEKMRNRPDGAPTPGLKPVGEIRKHWQALFAKRRGELVELAIDPASAGSIDEASASNREAAWEAFKALSAAGWRSQKPYGPREDLHER